MAPSPSRATDSNGFEAWQTGPPPFSFTYNGKSSSQFLSTWTETQDTVSSTGGETYIYTFTDPATKLVVTAQVRTFDNYSAVDWVLNFTNGGSGDTPIISNVQPLHWTVPVLDSPSLYWEKGSSATEDDFQPWKTSLSSGQGFQLNSLGGRSSNNNMPFFNYQDGDHGMMGAIGWTGNWVANFSPSVNGNAMTFTAGMQQTNFLLHAGETVRTPRIVLLDWTGDYGDSQNLWRTFVLNFYSPRDTTGKVVTLPVSFGSWGAESIDTKLSTIQSLHNAGVAIDEYWVDAGWFGSGNWFQQRGDWTANPTFYPNGFPPLGSALKQDGYGFLLWFEAETADPGSNFLTEHPDWYIVANSGAPALLNFGNPAALEGMTDFASNLFTTSGVTWYRQDFNIEPAGYWAANDTPNRVGITEMKDIAGLYAYWDALRTNNPGLQIDNCASGGRRLDIETMSRSVALWRTDYTTQPFDPIADQMFTQALNMWVPLNAGVYGIFGGRAPSADLGSGTTPATPSLIYAIRSAYSAGLTFGAASGLSLTVLQPAVAEFDQVRPYFQGNFYSLTPYASSPWVWTAWQLDRPDLKSGVIICLRRQGSITATMKLPLHSINPAGTYQVEIRTGWQKGTVQIMSGQQLATLNVNISGKPGSALIFYTLQ